MNVACANELRMMTGDALMGFIKLPRGSRGIHENPPPPPPRNGAVVCMMRLLEHTGHSWPALHVLMCCKGGAGI